MRHQHTRTCPQCSSLFTTDHAMVRYCSRSCARKARVVSLVGRQFGRLCVTAPHPAGRWSCTCSCGAITVVPGSSLTSGNTRSCGCGNRAQAAKRLRTHGDSNSREYHSWAGMIQRCENPRNPSYASYGGRGITACAAWHTYETFLAGMGRAPTPLHSLDRINVNGNYEPGNVRWASPVVQANNKRANVVLTWKGKTQTLAEWARERSIPANTLRSRLRLGWPMDRVLTVPARSPSRAHIASASSKP